jgi:nitrogen regulatory protein P-II 2
LSFASKKLLTLVSEAALENRLIRDVLACGAKGYTVSGARGTGPRNQRNGDLEGGNIRIEVVADSKTIDQIIDLVQREYFPHYALSLWISEVSVLRDERY